MIYEIVIAGWRPALANELTGNRWKAGRLKKLDKETLTTAIDIEGIPAATGRRRVSLVITTPRGKFPDPDAPLKSVLDAMKHAKVIIDDSDKYCDWEKPRFARGPKGTTIFIEDL